MARINRATLVVHGVGHQRVLGKLGGDPPIPLWAVPVVMMGPDPAQQRLVCRLPRFSFLSGAPLIKAGALDLKHLAHPLHLMGATVVLNELEADHQVVSAAKYFVAFCRVVRSSVSRSTSVRITRLSVRRASTSTRQAGQQSPAPERLLQGPMSAASRLLYGPGAQFFSVARLIPRSAAAPA